MALQVDADTRDEILAGVAERHVDGPGVIPAQVRPVVDLPDDELEISMRVLARDGALVVAENDRYRLADEWADRAIECDHCGDVFIVPPCHTDRARFCSKECQSAATSVTLECAHCGSHFEVVRAVADRARYCSKECFDGARRERVTLECDHCGSPFEVKQSREDSARFCSRSCYNRFNDRDEAPPEREAPGDSYTLTCADCGRAFGVFDGGDEPRRRCGYCRAASDEPDEPSGTASTCRLCGRTVRSDMLTHLQDCDGWAIDRAEAD